MASKRQACSTAGTNRQRQVSCDEEPPAQDKTLKVVACPICQALYLPVNEQQNGTLAAIGLLETAFLKVCHFCFRCRRFACPQCWNPVHHVCAACGEEERLPFRSPVPSLEGLAFLPPRTARALQDQPISFLCRRNGRFYTPDPGSQSRPQPGMREAASPPPSITSEPHTSGTLPVLSSTPTTGQVENYPLWLREVLGHAGSAQEDTIYVPAPGDQTLAQPGVSPVSPVPAEEDADQDDLDDASDEEVSLLERVENILIVITALLLLTVVLMIVLSLTLAPVNAFFLRYLHLDIRTEVAYLLQLR